VELVGRAPGREPGWHAFRRWRCEAHVRGECGISC
jgi:hypothetical protein